MKKQLLGLLIVLLLLMSLMPAAAQSGTLAADQTVNDIIEGAVTTIIPGASGGGQRDWTRVTFAAPFTISPTGELVPYLATGWDVSSDGLTYTLHLDPAAKFSDGTPITAASLKAAWEWEVQAQNLPSWGGLFTILKNVVGVSDVNAGTATTASGLVAVDDHTLNVVLIAPIQGFQQTFGSYLLGIIKASDDVNNPDYWRNPTTAGPYLLAWNPDTNDVDLTTNPNWWGKAPTLTHIHFGVIADVQTKLIAYQNGEIDMFKDTGGLLDQISSGMADQLVPIPELGFFFLGVSNQVPPTDDVHVRRALLLSIDHNAILKALFPADPITNTIVQSSTACYNASYTEPYDPAMAKQELAQSKYGSAASMPAIQLYYFTSIDFWGRIVTAYQQQWQDNLGIQVQLNAVDSYTGTTGNIYRFSGGPTINDPSDILTKFATPDGGYAKTINYVPPDSLVQAITAANALAPDDPGRCAAYQQVEQTLIGDEAAVWPQITPPYNFVVKPYIQGVQTSLNQDIDWENVSVLAH